MLAPISFLWYYKLVLPYLCRLRKINTFYLYPFLLHPFKTAETVPEIVQLLRMNYFYFHIQSPSNEVLLWVLLYKTLEIKPCGLGSIIRDMEVDLIYWWSFWTSMEALRCQIPYSDRSLWHFNSMFGPSHSAKVSGRCMACGH
jgi:hypothetical protein